MTLLLSESRISHYSWLEVEQQVKGEARVILRKGMPLSIPIYTGVLGGVISLRARTRLMKTEKERQWALMLLEGFSSCNSKGS